MIFYNGYNVFDNPKEVLYNYQFSSKWHTPTIYLDI